MGKSATYKKLRGSGHFRQRLVLATLSLTPIVIEDFRINDASPGIRPHEVSLLRLLERISDDCLVEINETGTKLRYRPGVILGGKHLVHDCGISRSIGYFLEPLIVIGIFGKKPISITLKGITNDSKDPSIDVFQRVVPRVLKQFGVEGLHFKIESRGFPPLGGGELVLGIPVVQDSLTATHWIDEGMVKKIGGVTSSSRVSPLLRNRMRYAARGIFNRLLPDVFVDDDKSRSPAGSSPGYGICLVAETTSGCLLSAEVVVSLPQADESTYEVPDEKEDMKPADDVGIEAASILLGEIEEGGVVDSAHQGLLFLLCALCPPDVSKVRVGKLTPYGVETLRHIKDFLGVQFSVKPDPSTNTVLLSCVGCGMRNLSRKVQ